MNNITLVEKEIIVLEKIKNSKNNIRQRDLSRWLGISLGMTNVILKRLVNKGLLKIHKINNRNIKYLVSPKGLEAIAKKSYICFKNTVKNVVIYKKVITELLREIKKKGFSGVSLIGFSDIDFLIEYICSKCGLLFSRKYEDSFYIIYSEDFTSKERENELIDNSINLREIVIKL